ncbi:MAG: hypothetical protein HYZ31_01460 [Gammaproteobacteria bacterium]|nr:hypothetical protein [Gammaproteobacteria bacterium]
MHRRIILTLLVFSLQQTPGQAETTTPEDLNSLRQEISAMQQQLDKLTASIDPDNPTGPYGLKLSGFFDISANLTDVNDHPFELGDLEADVIYDKAENFAVSAAGIVNNDGASVGVAILDYHVNANDTPARGALYEEDGYHIQIGRFDIPFAIDYSFYAAPDRVNISAPLTTDRILKGGLNGDGMRTYGSWSVLEYTLYATNSLFEDTGYTAGTRIGCAINDHFVIGGSALSDRDADDNVRHRLTALDLGWKTGIAEFHLEAVRLDRQGDIQVNNVSTGAADETGSHLSMVVDLSPVTLFLRFEKWSPDYTQIPDPDPLVTTGLHVEKLERATIAARYVLDSYLQFKLEYFKHTKGETAEPDFDNHLARVQMVARF